jgi:flagellar hook-basal body complex protein FliE
VKINQALTLVSNAANTDRRAAEKSAREANVTFGQTLGQAMKDVNSLQQEAGKAVNQMIVGQDVDLHDVMIAVEKAKTSFDLLMEIRNKTVDAYRELMRIQV